MSEVNRVKIFIHEDKFRKVFRIGITGLVSGNIYACNDVSFVPYTDHSALKRVLEMDTDSVTQLMSDLWDAGIRPMILKQEEIPGELLKTNDDYRKILFALLGINDE